MTHIPFPRRHIVPHRIPTDAERALLADIVSMFPATLRQLREHHLAEKAARLDIERPARIAYAHRRLTACYWAGWTPLRRTNRFKRPVIGPIWLGVGHRPRHSRAWTPLKDV